MLWIFHEFPLHLTHCICCNILGLGPNSTICIQFSFFLNSLLLFNVLICWFCQCLISACWLKLWFMITASSMHLFLILNLSLKWILILISLINAIGNIEVAFLSHSWSVRTCQHVSRFCYRFAIFTPWIWINMTNYVVFAYTIHHLPLPTVAAGKIDRTSTWLLIFMFRQGSLILIELIRTYLILFYSIFWFIICFSARKNYQIKITFI